MAAEGTALVSSAAPPTKRRALGHFETSLVLSTSTALTGPQKEKIIVRLTRAGEGRMARVRVSMFVGSPRVHPDHGS